jgi:hypothetical protein
MKEKGVSVKIARVPEEVASRFDWKAKGLVVEFDRDQSDYIYLSENLINLQGRKYHRKRNHIKQFKEKYIYQYLPLTIEWISECLRLEAQWCDFRQCEVIPGLFNESVAIKEALTHFEALGVNSVRNSSGALNPAEIIPKYDPVAEQWGIFSNDTIVIHIEKANPAFEGLYPLINQAFLESHWSGFTYVNREQDLGEDGLRKAKESYFPHRMINKYTIGLNE